MTSAPLPFVSILLPVHGETDDLVECLASLARQTYPHDRFEVLVADGSDVPVEPSVAPAGVDVRVLPNPAHLMTPGLNLAASYARGEYLAIVSAHSWLPDDYLAQMTRIAQASGADNVGTRVRKVARSAWGKAIAAATSSPFGVGSSVQHHGAAAGPADSAFPGFIDRSMFERLGGFNTDLACNEDDEFNARVRAAGGSVWYDPAVEVAYRPRETLGSFFRQQFRYGRWKVAVARLGVPNYLRPHHLIPSAAVVGAIAGPVLIVVWRPFAIPVGLAALAYVAIAVREGFRLAPAYGASPLRTALVFPVAHAGYGVGFLRGLLDRGLPKEGRR